MTSSPPVASAAPLYSGGRASEGLARSGRPGGVSTEHWALPSVRQRRVGQLLGLSISSPLAERVSGPHCFCRPDLIHGADSSGCASLACSKECAAVSLPGRPASKVYLATKEGHSGLRLALQDPAVASLVPELAPAGPPEAKWWACAGCGRGILPGCAGPPAAPSGASARHLASCSCGSGRTR